MNEQSVDVTQLFFVVDKICLNAMLCFMKWGKEIFLMRKRGEFSLFIFAVVLLG